MATVNQCGADSSCVVPQALGSERPHEVPQEVLLLSDSDSGQGHALQRPVSTQSSSVDSVSPAPTDTLVRRTLQRSTDRVSAKGRHLGSLTQQGHNLKLVTPW